MPEGRLCNGVCDRVRVSGDGEDAKSLGACKQGDAASERGRSRPWNGLRRQPAPGHAKGKASWWELPALLVVALLMTIAVKTFVVQPFFIPSESMEHTLYGCSGCSGDRILVNKPIYHLRAPHPGDIVVFHAPRGWDDEPASHPPSNVILRTLRGFGQLIGVVPPDGEVLVKRVIATGGQTIRGSSDGAVQISVNGPRGPFRTLHEPFVFNDPGATQPAFGPVTVPRDRLWVMGDHRTDSEDSRFHCSANGENENGNTAQCSRYVRQATVPDGKVIGKAVVIAWPPSRWRTLGTPATFTKDASAAGPALPATASFAIIAPVWALRRRTRRRARRLTKARQH